MPFHYNRDAFRKVLLKDNFKLLQSDGQLSKMANCLVLRTIYLQTISVFNKEGKKHKSDTSWLVDAQHRCHLELCKTLYFKDEIPSSQIHWQFVPFSLWIKVSYVANNAVRLAPENGANGNETCLLTSSVESAQHNSLSNSWTAFWNFEVLLSPPTRWRISH